jgi:hypothetical protein
MRPFEDRSKPRCDFKESHGFPVDAVSRLLPVEIDRLLDPPG